jgi:hypothetical protein
MSPPKTAIEEAKTTRGRQPVSRCSSRIAHLQIGLGLPRHDGGEVVDDVRAHGEQPGGGARHGQIDRRAMRGAEKAVRGPRRDDIGHRQMPDRRARETAIGRYPLGKLAAEHPGRPQDHDMHPQRPLPCRLESQSASFLKKRSKKLS